MVLEMTCIPVSWRLALPKKAWKSWGWVLSGLCLWDLTECNSWWELCNMSNGFLCSNFLMFLNKMQSHCNTVFHRKSVNTAAEAVQFNTSLWVAYGLHKLSPSRCTVVNPSARRDVLFLPLCMHVKLLIQTKLFLEWGRPRAPQLNRANTFSYKEQHKSSQISRGLVGLYLSSSLEPSLGWHRIYSML